MSKNQNKESFGVGLSTIATTRYSVFKKINGQYKTDKPFKSLLFKSKLLSIFCEFFRVGQNIFYKKNIDKIELKESPVFILGHWRSGTTMLHNLMAKDPQFAYVTTYQGVFPNQLFFGKFIFKNFMQLLMPKNRPVDNVEMHTDYPQEEEFALGCLSEHSYYNWFYFPRDAQDFINKYLQFKDLKPEDYSQWKEQYKYLAKQTLLAQDKNVFLSKNPPNTARIKELKDAFPNAKFIYIHRDPYEVFQSTMNFFDATLNTLKMQDFSKEELKTHVLKVYQVMMEKYEKEKQGLKENELIEIPFIDLLKDGMSVMKNIYNKLELNGWSEAEPFFKSFYSKQKEFKKKNYNHPQELIDLVDKNWK